MTTSELDSVIQRVTTVLLAGFVASSSMISWNYDNFLLLPLIWIAYFTGNLLVVVIVFRFAVVMEMRKENRLGEGNNS